MRRRQFLISGLAARQAWAGEEWRRSKPDLVVYRPKTEKDFDAENQHFLVALLPTGTFLAMWTRASQEAAVDQHIAFSRSTDQGRTWSDPQRIDGPSPGDAKGTGMASWGFPVVAPKLGRVYCFYNKNTGYQGPGAAETGALRAKWSDDDGSTWSSGHTDYLFARNDFSDPRPDFPQDWIVYQSPLYTKDGKVIAGYTHWANRTVHPTLTAERRTRSELLFLHMENILTERDPAKLVIRSLPEGKGIRLVTEPEPTMSVIQEPTVQELSDGRWITVARTLTDKIYFALSKNKGRSCSPPDILRLEPEGKPLLNPRAPCPLYKLSDGRFLLIFYNNDGGPGGPLDYKVNRTPASYSVGREIRGHATHRVRFSEPQILVSNDSKPIGPRGLTEIATYPSFFEYQGKRYFWYPDRKHFLLGKLITDEMLDSAKF